MSIPYVTFYFSFSLRLIQFSNFALAFMYNKVSSTFIMMCVSSTVYYTEDAEWVACWLSSRYQSLSRESIRFRLCLLTKYFLKP